MGVDLGVLMSEELMHRAGLTVTSYAGPAVSDGGSRNRVQLYNYHGGEHRLIDLSAEQWDALREHFARERHPSSPARSRTSSSSTSATSAARGAGSG